jgi:predicted sulfurtransferase
MFDDRLSVPVGEPVSQCEKCGSPCARYENCCNVDCNRLYFLCVGCEQTKGLACSEACQTAHRTREKNKRLDPNLRTEGERERHRRHRAKRRLAAQSDPDRTTLVP